MAVISGTLTTAVADSGTFVVNYPSGVTLSAIDAYSANHSLVVNNNDVLPLSGAKFALSFGPSSVTITNQTGSSWPAGTLLALEAVLFGTPAGLAVIPVSADYTLDLGCNGKGLLHPAADTSGRTWTIPANSAVKFPIGATIALEVQNGAGAITLAINSDTLRLAGAGTTGSRTLAANTIATLTKLAATEWEVSGAGVS